MFARHLNINLCTTIGMGVMLSARFTALVLATVHALYAAHLAFHYSFSLQTNMTSSKTI